MLLVFILISSTGYSQSAKDLFKTDSIIFYGMDCSFLTIVEQKHRGDDTAFYTLEGIKKEELPAFKKEFKRAAIQYRKLFKAKQFVYDSLGLKGRPDLKEGNSIIPDKNYVVYDDREGMVKAVKNYPAGMYKSGVAVVFIPSSIDEIKNKIGYYVIFFEIASKKIIVMDRMVADLGHSPTNKGYDLWKSGIMNILDQMPGAYAFWQKYPR